ncbi:YceD family protein [Arenibacterium sp. CAU 1754]
MSNTTALRVADLAQNRPTPFDLRPNAEQMQALAQETDLIALRKLTFSGEVKSQGKQDWVLTGHLGATVVQPCVVTLEPVTTRIETDVQRTYLTEMPEADAAEVEMPEDDTIERLGTHIDPAVVMAEALVLALPLYPRKEGADLGEAVFTEPGQTPMRDEDTKPFAGLSQLRDTLKKDT